MDRRKAMRLAGRWPKWMEEWKKEITYDNSDKDKEFFKFRKSLCDYAIEKTEANIPMIQWFIHCLYKRGFKIVLKRGRKE